MHRGEFTQHSTLRVVARRFPRYPRTIIELHSNSGIIGVGEAEGAAPAAFINQIVKPALLKGPLIDTQHLRALCRVDFADAASIGSSSF
jgi:hypothetical protein